MKIISYSLYGNNFRYTEPLILNAKSVKRYYPDWIIRVYHDETVSNEILTALKDNNIQLIDIRSIEGEYAQFAPKFWRFLPILDKNVEAIIFRDADSIFTIREAKLVNDWLKSDHDFHIIRDHQLHISPILAGMFGIKKGGFNIFKAELFNNSKVIKQISYNSDQIFLADYLYSKIIKLSLIHTSHFAFKGEKFDRIEKCINENDFIGAVFIDKDAGTKPSLIHYDFIIGIPFWVAKLFRYRIRPVLYLSYFYNRFFN